MRAKGYLIFHLNLAFSSVEEESQKDIIQACYYPLLNLIKETRVPIGIELTGWTLDKINQIDSNWIALFKELLDSGNCELIGSGYSQIIGPLVPFQVNEWNQRLGLEYYEKILGQKPDIAYVNEMVFSRSMVDLYSQFDYKAIIIDSDNTKLALNSHELPSHAEGIHNSTIQILWSDSILFQKMQHYAHGDISINDYQEYLKGRVQKGELLLPIYCNDAEIFDYRPGRFSEERSTHHEGEWKRINKLLNTISSEKTIEFISPTEALECNNISKNVSKIVNANYPIPVKKQNKYNIARWAVTGKDDLWLNTMCHLIQENFTKCKNQNSDDWRSLCELWSSDLRTHITDTRWKNAKSKLNKLIIKHNINEQLETHHKSIPNYVSLEDINTMCKEVDVSLINDDILLHISTKYLELDLNLRRGSAIQKLAFLSHGMKPCIGTIQHGYFESISLGADYYSGNSIIELPLLRKKVTDLEVVKPKFIFKNNKIIEIHNEIETEFGVIKKIVTINTDSEKVSLSYDLTEFKEIYGSVRLGITTLLNDFNNKNTKLICLNGGEGDETFDLCGEFDHTKPASTFVSSSRGFGATTGKIQIINKNKSIILQWKPSECAAMPMLSYKTSDTKSLSRLFFSLQEFDDTSKNVKKIKNKFNLDISAS